MSPIQTHSYTIVNALQSAFYRIPDYQREYVWTATEATQLLEGLLHDPVTDSVTQPVWLVWS
ncbi:DUF262 domain-containing protein [Rhodococcus pyridinivorans]|uniref:DUF262 domain-containing protein n=1 Tax=Rhodococcus pyridinivorans TaxID=103816 RepID=A0A7M2XQQ5_9NOCA|nr:DUF262 domain-containing protein [Rhodococcus pyridinivorans]QOW00169.1 hypothetical protein INP59_07415 [Rhodococcus pyridinivorans]